MSKHNSKIIISNTYAKYYLLISMVLISVSLFGQDKKNVMLFLKKQLKPLMIMITNTFSPFGFGIYNGLTKGHDC